MDVYIYLDKRLCASCAAAKMKDIRNRGGSACDDQRWWPQGPYQNGGGESDVPEHCMGGCKTFLRNPLTAKGRANVSLVLCQQKSRTPVLEAWEEFYWEELQPKPNRAPPRALPPPASSALHSLRTGTPIRAALPPPARPQAQQQSRPQQQPRSGKKPPQATPQRVQRRPNQTPASTATRPQPRPSAKTPAKRSFWKFW